MPAFIIRPSADLLKIHPELRHISHALALQYAFQEKVVTDKELENIGSRLWQAIGMTAGFNEARLQAGTAPLDIIIESDSPAIQQLPWETLHHPELGFLGRHENFTLSRRLSAAPTTAPLRKEPLRVLLFSALPDDLDAETGRLNSEEEQAQVLEAFLPWIQEGKVKLETPEDGQFATLQANLDEFKPHLVFLSGHGKFHHEPHTGEAPYGTFLFEGENGESVAIPDGQIAQVFAGTSVQCVVLSACESGKSASVELNNGLSYQLAAQGIPQVVGMRESIMDVAGIQFARAFCDGLLAAQGVGQALQVARMAITQPLKDEYQGNARYKLLAELSYGQWCLPSLLSQEPASLLVDWDFIAEPLPDYTPHIRLENITLPQQFFGRRRELRELRRMIRANASGHVLVTGAGGMGKTALAGKLADSLRKQDYHVFAWSAVNPETWVALAHQMVETLQYHNKEEFERESKQNQAPADYARLLLRLVMHQHDNRAVVFLDNLESVQDNQTLAIQHPELQAWLNVAHSMGRDAPHFILTSHWKMPEWADDAHYQLITPLYGDFLQFAQRQNLPKDFLKQRDHMHQLYSTFGGHFRALEYFSHAVQNVNLTNEQELFDLFKRITVQLQDEIEQVQVDDAEYELLSNMLSYKIPVPINGIKEIFGGDVNDSLLYLINTSLVEKSINHKTKETEYLLTPLIRSSLVSHGVSANIDAMEKSALFLMDYLKNNFTWRIVIETYNAFVLSKQYDQAQKLTVEIIVKALNLAGEHQKILDYWLLPLEKNCKQEKKSEILNLIGRQYTAINNYIKALKYLHRSKAINIRNKSLDSLAENFLNIGYVFQVNNKIDRALMYFEKALEIERERGSSEGQAGVLNNISQIHFEHKEDPKEALRILFEALHLFSDGKALDLKSTLLNNIGKAYQQLGDGDSSIKYYNKALKYQRLMNNKVNEIETLSNIAMIFYLKGNYYDSLDYLKRADSVNISHPSAKAVIYYTMAQNYMKIPSSKDPLIYFERAILFQGELNDKRNEATILNAIGVLYSKNKNFKEAFDFYDRALRIHIEEGNREGEAVTLNNIANIYDKQGKHKIAIGYFYRSLEVLKDINSPVMLCPTLVNLGYLEFEIGRHSDALRKWVTVYFIAKQANLAEALKSLTNIAEDLRFPRGLNQWDEVAKTYPPLDFVKEALNGKDHPPKETPCPP